MPLSKHRGTSKSAENLADLVAIEEAVTKCRACPRLVAWREASATSPRAVASEAGYWSKGVPGFGDPRARLLVVGLAPAANGANRTGRMFTGDRSGDFLFRAMHRAGFANQPTSIAIDDGLALQGAFVTGPVRCAPPENKPTRQEAENCRRFLTAELACLAPTLRVVLALGAFAYQAITREVGPLRQSDGYPARFSHGAEFQAGLDGSGGVIVLCSYHPSQRNVFTGRLTEVAFDAIFARAAELCQ